MPFENNYNQRFKWAKCQIGQRSVKIQKNNTLWENQWPQSSGEGRVETNPDSASRVGVWVFSVDGAADWAYVRPAPVRRQTPCATRGATGRGAWWGGNAKNGARRRSSRQETLAHRQHRRRGSKPLIRRGGPAICRAANLQGGVKTTPDKREPVAASAAPNLN